MKIDFTQLDGQSIYKKKKNPKFKIVIDNILCLKMATFRLLIYFPASYPLCQSPRLLPQYQMCTHAYPNRICFLLHIIQYSNNAVSILHRKSNNTCGSIPLVENRVDQALHGKQSQPCGTKHFLPLVETYSTLFFS
ncbi:hypothetical protein HYC85_003216 [Camellia sinensis]|uniref:Uncharacterized protein n=1 Tax=Camellia sinensis TaxID=4442 RepID=A0A7J7IBP6_CAMSI|nr:hypothetical protein HYC85_003216 [Camellia sinensis]